VLDEMLAFFDSDLASRLPGIPSEGIAEVQEDALFSLPEQGADEEDEIAAALTNLAHSPYVFLFYLFPFSSRLLFFIYIYIYKSFFYYR
jgi:hypothetical protein